MDGNVKEGAVEQGAERTVVGSMVEAMLRLSQEMHDGAEKGLNWVLDPGKGPDLFGTLETLSAEEASLAPIGGKPTIAGVAEHIRFSLKYSNDTIRGKDANSDWESSWAVTTVDEERWAEIQRELREQYEALNEFIRKNGDWTQEHMIAKVFSIITHTAYHLGALRQMRKSLGQSQGS